MKYLLVHGEFTIDFTPFPTDGKAFGAQWTIRSNDAAKAWDMPVSSGDLLVRGTCDEMAAFAKQQAVEWIDNTRCRHRR
ncbi:hypothetical protein [Paraburkholderia tropica]|uniref:hypothetical protein n=1 Tax=Paraburkholderia tropica TaxID=92647 RepID=UPI002AB7B08C|nr:hypothetical protein [Paraburkholderia tropica]